MAFDALAMRLRGGLLAAIRVRIGARLREKLDPEDVLQETLVRAYQSLARFESQSEDSFLSWLVAIAENLILDAAKRQRTRRELELELEPEPAADGVSPSREARRDERFDRLKKSIAGLSPDYQKVLLLSRNDGLKIQEIAERMGRSESAVKNLLFRAMKELKQSFGDTESLHLPPRTLCEDDSRN